MHPSPNPRPNPNPTIRHITFDCTNEPYELACFWAEFLGCPVSDIDKPGDDEVLVELPDGAPGLLFVRVEEAKTTKNRIHFDLGPTGRTRAEEVERAVSLGAHVRTDRTLPNGRGWVVMADPEGNEFCIERGELG
ncbi:VOC family protein [Streptomyces massasporeus]|uniref:VOC family protein n=1 Tax=Streptomyces massasporeus TaxID=67324 RepID=UPI00381132F4